MSSYSFQRVSDDTDVPVGECENDAMALAQLGRLVGGKFSLKGEGEAEYVMKRSSDGWGRPSIPVYRRA